jgi:integrase
MGVHKAAKNTALLEIKFLGMIMDEAIQSGFCNTNPCRKLGIKRDKPKAKPKIEIDEHRLITRALKREPEWMRVSYKIAWEQGCRFSETCFPLSDVDLARNVIGFRTKGEKETIAEFPLSPRLRPLLRRS